MVGGNTVIRDKAPISVCSRPVSQFITSFVNRDGVIPNAVIRSCGIHFINGRFRYSSTNVAPNRGVRVIVHPRSLRLAAIRGNGLIIGVSARLFHNIRCRVVNCSGSKGR